LRPADISALSIWDAYSIDPKEAREAEIAAKSRPRVRKRKPKKEEECNGPVKRVSLTDTSGMPRKRSKKSPIEEGETSYQKVNFVGTLHGKGEDDSSNLVASIASDPPPSRLVQLLSELPSSSSAIMSGLSNTTRRISGIGVSDLSDWSEA
jgi:hypothetical protein